MNREDILEILNKYRKTVVAVVGLIVCFIICMIINASQTTVLRNIQSQTEQLHSSLAVMEEKMESSKNSAVSDSGLNVNRLHSDREIIDEFLTQILTFNSFDEYVVNRNILLDEYFLNPNSTFMRIFYQEAAESLDFPNSYIHVFNPDWNYSLKMDSFVPYIIRIDDDEYTYFCDVTAVSLGHSYRFGLVCTVDSTNTICFVQGYSLLDE